jgi:uncharacterized protein YegL
MKKTHYCLILDRSGSMGRNKAAVVDTFNEQIQQIKEDAKDQDIDVSLITFNRDVFEHLWCTTADKLEEASPESYNPSGGTSFRDAVGYVVSKYMAMDDANDEEVSYLINIISDGETYDDKHYSQARLLEACNSCHNTKRWTFGVLGCNQKMLNEVKAWTGIETSNMAVWSNKTELDVAYTSKVMRASNKGYFEKRKRGISGQSSNLYSNESCPVDLNLSDSIISASAAADDDINAFKSFAAGTNLDAELLKEAQQTVNKNSRLYSNKALNATSNGVLRSCSGTTNNQTVGIFACGEPVKFDLK